jgi:putative protease
MDHQRQPELLAPAGTLGMLATAVLDGADAVYVGPRGWSRCHPDYEFRHSQIRAAADYCHARDVKLRVAMDLEIPEQDFPLLLKKTADYVAWGIDGMIMKTPAAMALVRRHFPDMTIHAGAGANVQTFDEMMAVKAAGASHVVLSSKCTTLAAISAAKADADRAGLWTEVLISDNTCLRGAGNCDLCRYFPESFDEVWLDDDDGTRRRKILGHPDYGGTCYQPCLARHRPKIWARLPESVRIELQQGSTLGDTLVDELPALVRLGVATLKLQGSEHLPRLLGETIRCFRFAIDGIQSGRTNPADVQTMLLHLRSLWKERTSSRLAQTAKLHDALEARLAAASA